MSFLHWLGSDLTDFGDWLLLKSGANELEESVTSLGHHILEIQRGLLHKQFLHGREMQEHYKGFVTVNILWMGTIWVPFNYPSPTFSIAQQMFHTGMMFLCIWIGIFTSMFNFKHIFAKVF